MGKILENLHRTLAAGIVLTIIVFLVVNLQDFDAGIFFPALVKLIHVWFGILWIGLLYYFNFVQIPSMPKIPDEHKPAIGKVIAPSALFFFRWAALGTVVFGVLTALLKGYFHEAMTFQEGTRTIGIGMWLAIIMAANVWFIIWPNQKKALGIVEATADAKKAAGRIAMLASRTNTMLSLPMLYCMVFQKLGMY